MAVIAAGAMPVIADADASLTLCPKDFEAKITPHTKAVIPVHIQGFPCKMDEIMQIAKAHDIRVLEDACQADGGSYKGVRLGAIGDAGALSFNYYKIVTCGEGGALLTNNREIFERSLIYHDSSAIAFFGKQMEDFSATEFCGNEYRSNELCAAVLNVQFSRLEGLIADLRRTKKYVMDALDGLCTFAPSNDLAGDCGTTIAIQFDSEEKARAFATAEGVYGGLPIDTGKHVYKHWTPIMNKRGAYHPLMDPFKMEANRNIIPDYRADMCPKTLALLASTVYISIRPEWTEEQFTERAKNLKAALIAVSR
jgi:dTDP-4-amino-4,6-dideoxygalactose transaminase